jgi:S1-C subfamily serine protease
MKYPLLFAVYLCALFSVCCTGHQPAAPTHNALVEAISAETVALILRDSDGDIGPFCSGVWVGPETIVTAGHCAAALADSPVGSHVGYIVQNEVTGHFKEPKAFHIAEVVKYDEEHDLALLSDSHAPKHLNAHLATTEPVTGDGLHFVGQASGYYWTYMRGTYEHSWATLYQNERKGPWMQVSAPIVRGMSGSGAFDENGLLVGICSATSANVTDVGFYVHMETVRKFIN